MRFFSSIILMTLIMIAVLSVAAISAESNKSFADEITGWNSTLKEVTKTIEKGDILPAKQHEIIEMLYEIRSKASKSSSVQKELLQSQKEVLAILGEAPAEGEEEAEDIKAKRQQINDEIKKIDSYIKQANLVTARIDEQIALLKKMREDKLQKKLFEKESFPFDATLFGSLSHEIPEYISNIEYGKQFLFWAFIVILVMALSFPMTRGLNKILTDYPAVHLSANLNHWRMLIAVVISLLVFFLRFDVINFKNYKSMEHFSEAFGAIVLSIIMITVLKKIKFEAPAYANKSSSESSDYSWIFNGLKKIISLILLAVPVMVLLGYVNLGIYIASNVLATILSVMIFIWLRELIIYINGKIYAANKQDDENKSQDQEQEVSPLLITFVEPVLAVFSIVIAMFFWGMTTDDITGWLLRYQSGIPIGNITLDFISIGSAIILFTLLYMTTKLLQWFLSGRVFPYTNMDRGVKDAIIAISGYVGIIIAVIAAMGAIGLDMSSLAIVAGALSVGIGFGLQAIFSNFVSGLILLFERPVKVGDWVIVGEHYGLIKKIRVRSTEIETFWNSSVIVPNSQLISEAVTNWTLHDRIGRVDIQIGVAYGSDTQKVKELLLEAASKHNQVKKNPAPRVLFMNFGDSSLDFELRCFIRNIRDIYRVSSDLRFDIDDIFKEHDIEIPFPQRDLHIRSDAREEGKDSN